MDIEEAISEERERGIREKLPKNNTISMKLEPEECETIAKLAYIHSRKTTAQAKIIFRNGLYIDQLITAVSKHLQEKNKEDKYFGGIYSDSFTPSLAECLKFIANAVDEAIAKDK